MENTSITTNLIADANLIVDCDEILVNISPLWTRKVLEEKEYFGKYLDLEPLLTIKDEPYFDKLILRRKVFYITDWLKKKDVEKIPDEVVSKFMSLYNDDEEYYYNLPLTRMARALVNFSYHPSIKKIYVVTRCTDGKNYASKERLIQSIFPSLKLEIIKVPSGCKKSDYIKNINIRNGFIFEDELSNIEDYIVNANNVTECTFYVPKLGYNIPNMELVEKIEKKNVSLRYYDI